MVRYVSNAVAAVERAERNKWTHDYLLRETPYQVHNFSKNQFCNCGYIVDLVTG